MIDQNTLSLFGFFSKLPAAVLSDMAAASRLLSFEPSTVIFRSGDEADMLYGVIEGEIELSLEIIEKNLDAQVEFEEAVHRQVMEKELED
jgi:CRP-like cAMP-binding protein